jgi:hypothetical protein
MRRLSDNMTIFVDGHTNHEGAANPGGIMRKPARMSASPLPQSWLLNLCRCKHECSQNFVMLTTNDA